MGTDGPPCQTGVLLPHYNESTCGADASVLGGNARVYLHVHSHHLGVVITKVRRSVTMLNNAMGMTDDRSMKVGHYVATLAVVAS